MTINYTKGKIRMGLFLLALEDGNLRRRVPRSCAKLMAAAYRDGFEQEFNRISEIMKRVYKGDWAKVSDAELSEIAAIIWRLNERLDSAAGRFRS
jgi:hypothetical protein